MGRVDVEKSGLVIEVVPSFMDSSRHPSLLDAVMRRSNISFGVYENNQGLCVGSGDDIVYRDVLGTVPVEPSSMDESSARFYDVFGRQPI